MGQKTARHGISATNQREQTAIHGDDEVFDFTSTRAGGRLSLNIDGTAEISSQAMSGTCFSFTKIVQGINHKYFALIQKTDGYSYSEERRRGNSSHS